MLNDLADIANRRTLRKGRDEIVVGEIVHLMITSGMRTIQFKTTKESQSVRFGTPADPLLHSLSVKLKRKTGNDAVTDAVVGSKATLSMVAEIKNYVSDPDDLIKMWRTNLSNMGRMPVLGQIKLGHQVNSVTATSWQVIDLNDFAAGTRESRDRLQGLLTSSIAELTEVLEPYKRESTFEIDA